MAKKFSELRAKSRLEGLEPNVHMEVTPRQQLRARYPAILAHASLSFGDGWIGIMEALCERLQFHADHNAMLPVEITQAKEEYGELSVLYSGGNDYAAALVDMAEAMSLHVCEICGKPGKSNDGLGVKIVRTRCPECGSLPHTLDSLP